jgi:membrane-associated phospholipid phosphatase
MMTTLTSLGDDKFLAIVLLLVMFSISFRKGILLTQIFMWVGLATNGMKAYFNMPRPPFVHADIQNLQHGEFDTTPFTSAGSESFLGAMDPEVLAAFQARNDQSWGFPSGHVSSTVALWGGIALLFRRKVLYWLAAILTILVALTRMYLGRHFLGDVFGGILLGVGILWLAHLIMTRWPFLVQPLKHKQFTRLLPVIIYYAFWIVVPLLLAIFSPEVFGKLAGYLFG